MSTKRAKAVIVLTVILCLSVCLAVFIKKGASDAGKPLTLNVSLYKTLPDYASFERTVEECWKEKHPDVELNFVDWDCYSGSVPEDLDVFVFDVMSLDAAAVNAKISDEKKAPALEFLNMITGKDLMAKVSANG